MSESFDTSEESVGSEENKIINVMITSSNDAKDRTCGDIMRKEGWDITISSSVEYDKSLIILSTASLGFIFGIMKDGYTHNSCTSFLILVLVLLLISISCSLLSFWFDQLHGNAVMTYADLCYIDHKDEYRSKTPWSYYAAATCKFLSGVSFIFALILFFNNLGNSNNNSDHDIYNQHQTMSKAVPMPKS